jgi:5-methylcytosine-specific restriction endonuclease McrA
MPAKPPTICAECSATVPDGGRYCIPHRDDNRQLRSSRERNSIRRAEGLKRLYDAWAWRGRQGARRATLARDPFCQIAILCEGRGASTDVDHIIRAELYIEAHGGDQSFFYDLDNLRGACHEDHAHKTSLENRGTWNEAEAVKALAEAERI